MIARIAVSTIVFAACGPALFLYALPSLGAFHVLATTRFAPPPDASFYTYSFVFGTASWLLLAVMAIAWVRQKPLGTFIPATGTICALLGIIPFVIAGPQLAALALPGVAFAVYLVSWHTMQTKIRHG